MVRRHRRAGVLWALAALLAASTPEQGQGAPMVQSEPRGFNVGRISHEVNTNQIVVRLNVTATDRTVPILYMSKEGWPETRPASSSLRSNPCEQGVYGNDNVCCINALVEAYQVAPSVEGIYGDPGVCARGAESGLWERNYTGTSMANSVLRSLVTSSDASKWDFLSVGRAADGSLQFPAGVESSVQLLSANTYGVELRVDHSYVKSRAMSTVVGSPDHGAFKYEFYVGVTFVTLLDYTGAVHVTSAQVTFDYFKSDFVFMSIATEQEATPVKQIDVVVHQGKSLLDLRLYQYLEFDVSYEADRAGGTAEIDRASLRYVRHASILDVTAGEWHYPCAAGGSYETDARGAFDALAEQSCLPRTPMFCEFDDDENFFMPFPAEFATEEAGYVSGGDANNNLYVKFDLLVTGADSYVHTSEVLIGINLQEWPVLAHCEDRRFEYSDVTDALDITVTAGIESLDLSAAVLTVSDSPDRQISEVAPGSAGGGAAGTYASAALAVEFDARRLMGRSYASDFSLQVDSMVVLNFLGAENRDYDAIRLQLSRGQGFAVARAAGDLHYTLAEDFGDDTLCTEVIGTAGVPAAQLSCFWRTVIVADEVQPVAEKSLHFYRGGSGAAGADAAKAWIAETIMNGGADYGADAPAEYFDGSCRHAGDTASNVRSYGCLYIDPAYRWLAAVDGADGNSQFSVGDKTIVVAVVTIVDGSGNIQRRRLLTADSTGGARAFDLHGGAEQQAGVAGISGGSPARARRLLQVDNAAALTAQAASSVFALSTAGVAVDKNLIYISGGKGARAQLLRIATSCSSEVSLRTFAANVQRCMPLLAGGLGPSVARLQPVGFSRAPTAQTLAQQGAGGGASRRLLAESTAPSNTNVSIAAIIESVNNFGALFTEQFRCTLAALANATRVLETADAEQVVQSCGDVSFLAGLRDNIRMELSTCTSSMLDVPLAECNQLIVAVTVAAGGVPLVDPLWLTKAPDPGLTFGITLGLTLAEVQADSIVTDTLRTAVALVFEVAVDRVVVQFAEVPAGVVSRRLLQASASVTANVWVYDDDRAEASPSLLAGQTPTAMEAFFDTRLSPALSQVLASSPGLQVQAVSLAITDPDEMVPPEVGPAPPPDEQPRVDNSIPTASIIAGAVAAGALGLGIVAAALWPCGKTRPLA